MKTKPVIIAISIVILLLAGLLLARSKYFAKPEKDELTQFLTAFNDQVSAGNADSLHYFFARIRIMQQ